MRILLPTLMALLLYTACESEGVDVTPPSIEVQSFTPAPTKAIICGAEEDSVFNLSGGGALSFIVNFKDDGALSQYKIDIHNNFDCHGHGGAATPGISIPGISNQTTDWTVLDIVALAGQEGTVDRSLSVPENVTAGTYHFQIQVLDEAGNDDPLANFYSLKILNLTDTVAPMLSASAPSGSFSVAKGEKVNFKGEVTDNFSLSDGGNGLLFLSYTDLSSGNTFTSNAVFPFDDTVDKTYSFDFEYTVPNTLVSGRLYFHTSGTRWRA